MRADLCYYIRYREIERNDMTSLNEQDVWQIYGLLDGREHSLREIAALYPVVSHQTISHIKNGNTWKGLRHKWIKENGDVSHWGGRVRVRSELTGAEKDACAIHARLLETDDWDAVSVEFGKSIGSVKRLASGKSWKSLGLSAIPYPIVKGNGGENNANSVLTPGKVREIRRRYEQDDEKQTVLANEYGVKQPTIYKVVNYMIWKSVAPDASS